jgi:hypothetical protein
MHATGFKVQLPEGGKVVAVFLVEKNPFSSPFSNSLVPGPTLFSIDRTPNIFNEYASLFIRLNKQKELFEAVNHLVSTRGGWVTSLPGAQSLIFEVPVRNPLPDLLSENGWKLARVGMSERLVTNATETFYAGDGMYVPRIVGAGIVPVERWEIQLG